MTPRTTTIARIRGGHPGAVVLAALGASLLLPGPARPTSGELYDRIPTDEQQLGVLPNAEFDRIMRRMTLARTLRSFDDDDDFDDDDFPDGRGTFPYVLSKIPAIERGDLAAPVAGDPVVLSRADFVHGEVDLDLDGIAFTRYFSSFLDVSRAGFFVHPVGAGPMGANWVHNFVILLVRYNPDFVGVTFGQGRMVFFGKTGGGWAMLSPPFTNYQGTRYQMVERGSRLEVLDPLSERILSFEAAGIADGEVRGAVELRDSNGNALVLAYNADRTLAGVSDGRGASLGFEYVASGGAPRISRVVDHTGRAVSFEYQGAQLVGATDPLGRTTRYGYTGPSLMTTLTLPRGNVPVTNAYAGTSVVSQTDGEGHVTRFAYQAGSTRVLDPAGNEAIHSFDAALRQTAIRDQAGNTLRFGYDAFHRRTTTTDRMGDTSRVDYHQASGKVERRTDNEGRIWSYTYPPRPGWVHLLRPHPGGLPGRHRGPARARRTRERGAGDRSRRRRVDPRAQRTR
jgi:YD repeat-containing protein